MTDYEVFIGWDYRERLAWEICARSIIAHSVMPPPPIRPISMQALQAAGLWDVVSDAPMSTEFALARFFVPFMTRAHWAIFCDTDFMFRADIGELIAHADKRYAVQVVQHPDYIPRETMKMDGQPQLAYKRKNWSSLVLWNMSHAGARRLNQHDANVKPGLWLHQFMWLNAHEIGALPAEWNWLDGTSDTAINPKAVHFTRGTPDILDKPMSYRKEWCDYISIEQADRFAEHKSERAVA